MKYAIADIGRQLQQARARQGLTQRALAKLAGTTQARVSNIENGGIDVRVSTLIELARNLNLEFMLAPRRHVPAVHAIQQSLSSEKAPFHSEDISNPRPAYRLDDEDDD